MSKDKISMKLLIDKSQNKVLFAEAGKDCVDFLFHILSLPLGSVVGFLTKEAMVGSVGTLYGSFESLSDDYVLDSVEKDSLLNPHPSSSDISYVKEGVTYMIMDDLCIKPVNSTISTITQLNELGIKDVSSLEVKEVILDDNQDVVFLKASLMSKTVLTDVFLPKQPE